MNTISLIIDFDSTIVAVESLELLFEIALKDHPEKERILTEVTGITNAGMNGDILFSESLSRRIQLLPMSKELITETITSLKSTISESFLASVTSLLQYDIHIVSGGFKELIIPLVEPLGIPADRVHANTFIFNGSEFSGIDTTNPLANDNGKTVVAQSLSLQPYVIGIGDGFSDLQVKTSGVADQFFYYSEFVEREKIMKCADKVVKNFHDVLEAIMLCHSL
jgi:D-3-phosphoglycerate dehydrogenase / 2-oxoglutarate reductase